MSSKDCFLDGKSTSYYLNTLIEQQWDGVRVSVHLLTDDDELRTLERQLIGQLQPQWYVQLKKSGALS